MRILTKPKVYLVSRPTLVRDQFDQFLADNDLEWPTPFEGTDAETLVELAGRCCYMSFGKKAGSKSNKAYIDNLIGLNREGIAHGAVVEHPHYSFLVTGGGRGFSHEQVRHRVGVAYSQLSTRYCDYEREGKDEGTWDPGFTVPALAQLSDRTREKFESVLRQSQQFYCELLPMIEGDLQSNPEFAAMLEKMPQRDRRLALRKAARGAARDVLPIASEAIMTITMNVRTAWNAGVARASIHADGAIRGIYVQILRIMQKEFPTVFEEVRFEKIWDGSDVAVFPREKL